MNSARRKPFRLTEVVTAEDELHTAVAKALRVLVMPPAAWTCFPAGNMPLEPRFAAKLARFGLAPGWPDLLVLFGGRLFGVELKRVGGRLSKTRLVLRRDRRGNLRQRLVIGQAEVFPLLLAAGMADIAVCTSVEAVLTALRGWGVPLRLRDRLIEEAATP